MAKSVTLSSRKRGLDFRHAACVTDLALLGCGSKVTDMALQTLTKSTPPDVINTLRVELGLTEVALASAAGFPRSTLRTKIHNVELFTIAELRRLGSALGTDYRIWLD